MFSLLSGLLASAVAPPLQPRDLHRPRPASSCRCSLIGLGAVGLLCGIALLLSGRSPLDGPPGWLAPTATVPACATLRACMAALAGAAPGERGGAAPGEPGGAAERGGAAPGERGGAAPTELGDRGQAVAPSRPAARRPPAEALSAEAHRGVLREATAWAAAEVPLFECSDVDITTAYYYRWRVFWLHLKRDARYGYTLSEFLPRVGWSGP